VIRIALDDKSREGRQNCLENERNSVMKTHLTVFLLGALICSPWVAAQDSAAVPETKAKAHAVAEGALWSANESIGANVVSANGESLGKVEDIVLDRDKNRVAYLIVSYGGLLGFGNKHFAVPWQAFGRTADRDLSLNIDPEQLKNAPGFDKGTLPNTADPQFHEGVHSFYKTEPYSLAPGDRERSREAGRQEEPREGTLDWNSWVSRGDDTAWARRLGELLGTKIENAQGDTIAELEDVIVDTREARAVYAVVSFGGTLGFFQDTAIIPWNALRLNLAREAYATDATLAQLEQAKLSDTEYRNLEDREYSEALFATFETQPYWQEFGYEAESDRSTRTAETRTAETRRNDAPRAEKKDENIGDRSTVTGTVVSVSGDPETAPEAQPERGVRVRVRAEDGTVRTVHLAANEELQRQELTLNRGDKVVITGEEQEYRGHKVLQAREVQKDGKTVTFE